MHMYIHICTYTHTHIGEYTHVSYSLGFGSGFFVGLFFCYRFREDRLCFPIHFFLVHHYLLRVKPCQTSQNASPPERFQTKKKSLEKTKYKDYYIFRQYSLFKNWPGRKKLLKVQCTAHSSNPCTC